jgi:hypothetical protein
MSTRPVAYTLADIADITDGADGTFKLYSST